MKKMLITLLILAALCSLASCTLFQEIDVKSENTQNTLETTSDTGTGSKPLTYEKVDVYTLQTESENGMYTSFVLSTPDKEVAFNANQWEGTESKIFVEDLTGDGFPEVIAVFVSGTGTGIHAEEVHVFDGKTLEEYPVENLATTLSEHLSLSASDSEFIIEVSKQTYRIDKTSLPVEPEALFETISIGFINGYTVSDGILHYTTECGCAMGAYCGTLDAALKYSGDAFVFDHASFVESE